MDPCTRTRKFVGPSTCMEGALFLEEALSPHVTLSLTAHYVEDNFYPLYHCTAGHLSDNQACVSVYADDMQVWTSVLR